MHVRVIFKRKATNVLDFFFFIEPLIICVKKKRGVKEGNS